MKTLRLTSFPTILPLVKGIIVPEDDIFDKLFQKKLSELHPVYTCWIRMKAGYWCNEEFVTDNCSLPKTTGNEFILEGMLKPTMLYKSSRVLEYRALKQEIDRHIKAKIQEGSVNLHSRAGTIPAEVALRDEKAVVTVASSNTTKVPNKNARPIAFISILLSTPNYDRSGKLTAMAPAQMSDEDRIFSGANEIVVWLFELTW